MNHVLTARPKLKLATGQNNMRRALCSEMRSAPGIYKRRAIRVDKRIAALGSTKEIRRWSPVIRNLESRTAGIV